MTDGRKTGKGEERILRHFLILGRQGEAITFSLASFSFVLSRWDLLCSISRWARFTCPPLSVRAMLAVWSWKQDNNNNNNNKERKKPTIYVRPVDLCRDEGQPFDISFEQSMLRTHAPVFDAPLKARLHWQFLPRFLLRLRGDFTAIWIASSLHGRFEIALEIAAKIASVNGPIIFLYLSLRGVPNSRAFWEGRGCCCEYLTSASRLHALFSTASSFCRRDYKKKTKRKQTTNKQTNK